MFRSHLVSYVLPAAFILLSVACTQDRPRLRGVPRAPSAEEGPPEHAPPGAPAVRAPAPAPTARAPLPAPAPSPGPAFAAAAQPSREGWNDAQIDWQPYDVGLAQARATGRPICLVLTADWCPHCHNYSHVFEDPRVVERARSLVMVRIDTDAQREVAARYVVDGGYVPRTYFLSADGQPLPVESGRPRFRYFFDENDPASILSGMERALASL